MNRERVTNGSDERRAEIQKLVRLDNDGKASAALLVPAHTTTRR